MEAVFLWVYISLQKEWRLGHQERRDWMVGPHPSNIYEKGPAIFRASKACSGP